MFNSFDLKNKRKRRRASCETVLSLCSIEIVVKRTRVNKQKIYDRRVEPGRDYATFKQPIKQDEMQKFIQIKETKQFSFWLDRDRI
jgi:hypothetical protein